MLVKPPESANYKHVLSGAMKGECPRFLWGGGGYAARKCLVTS